MTQFYTLEEAAGKLGLTTKELKRRVQQEWKSTLRVFPADGTLHFDSKQIDELARSLGEASDPNLKALDAPSGDVSLNLDDSGESDLLGLGSDDDFKLAPSASAPPGKPADSDARLFKDTSSVANTGSDEDIAFRLEEESVDGPRSGSGARSGPGTGRLPVGQEESSEFELSLEGSSEFTFELNDDNDEVSLGDLPVSRSGDRAGNSGINLGAPADSGISLEKSGPKTGKLGKGPKSSAPGMSSSDDDIDFELSLDAGASVSRMGAPSKSSRNLLAESDDESSEFDLDLPDLGADQELVEDPSSSLALEGGEGNIFETDFEIPAVDESEANADALDEADSGSLDESGSEVLVVDEEQEAVDYDDDLETGDSISKVLDGANADDEEEEEGGRVYAAPARAWGPVTIGMLAITMPLVFVGALMAYELLHSMWGFQTGTRVASPLVQGVADMLDLSPKTK